MLENFHIENVALQIVNAVVLFTILRFLVYKPLHKFMQARSERIAASLEEARQAQAQAEQLRAANDAGIAEAEEAARARAAEITAAANASAKAIGEAARKDADSVTSKAKAVAQAEHDKAMAGLQGEVVDLAAEMAAQILRQECFGGGGPLA